MLLQIALPVPMYTLFDYAVLPEHLTDGQLPPIGGRVSVPFGRRTLIGMTVAHIAKSDSDVPPDKLKVISAVIDDKPIFDTWLLEFAVWLSGYYHYPLGETIAVMLPSLLNQGKPAFSITRQWHLTDHTHDETFVQNKISPRAKKQLSDFRLFAQHNGLTDDEYKGLGITAKTLEIFYTKGLIAPHTTTKTTPPATLNESHLTLNDEQQTALNGIKQAIDDGIYQGFLLNGVTGSGKTEVYLQAIEHALNQGKQALILVPEIGLTPQSQDRFAKRFNAGIITLHSRLNDKERLQGWQGCQDGTAQIIIATRSSLFYPFKNLGLIIIDEAHDLSYKQQDHLRYHACDTALYLGFRQKIPVILGSATPSLEQYKLATDGKLTQYHLTKRAGNATPPQFRLVDMRLGKHHHHGVTGELIHSELSPTTLQAIAQTLQNGHQVMVFLNRRGYAPILLCGACGWQADCVRCSSHLTLHKSTLKKAEHERTSFFHNHLKCHHCGYQVITPTTCPSCHSSNMVHLGQGTSGIYESLHAVFANPQTSETLYPIVQIDRDTVSAKGAWQTLYATVNTGKPMILVGTQMIAKGHHFDNVALVVVVDADAGFLSPNFRSPEHTAQTIIQVAGRAGRSTIKGQVLIQTYAPDNPLLQDLIRHGYDKFAQDLLKERQQLALPPYSHAVLIQAKHKDLQTAKDAINEIASYLPKPYPFVVLAPINAPMVRKNSLYYVQMLILASSRPLLHQVLNDWWYQVVNLPIAKKTAISIDIDPMGW